MTFAPGTPSSVTDMLSNDKVFADRSLRLLAASPGRTVVQMDVGATMTNGHDLCHGGYVFLLADEAFAIACNAAGQASVAASGAIEFLAPAHLGDVLEATATETLVLGSRGIYDVIVTATSPGQSPRIIASFRGKSARLRPST